MKPLTLFPRLIPTVGLEFLEPSDVELLEKLSKAQPIKEDGTIETLIVPRALSVGTQGYLLAETGCDYDHRIGKKILKSWKTEGFSKTFLSILAAAAKQSMPKILFLKGGMIAEPRSPSKIGKLGKKGLKKKQSLKLLESLKLVYEDMWPIEQLASVVNPYLKKTRK